ncbi:MAG: radical SAM family heme chaperone HemW [Verrucomicrobia bacterium]|nr:radical SAM family heme chaperone HemW [Verrucomicrobiota bacterium]
MPTTGSYYFHIPFCTKRCPYCHFYVAPDQTQLHKILLEGLELEYNRAQHFSNVASVYFGGGTPSLLGAKAIGEILSWIKPLKGTEITLEANPQEITPTLIESFAKAGINRLSIGVQSLDNALLKTLGRQHSAEKAIEAVKMAATFIPNITIDLMYEIPGQTLESWQSTLGALEYLPITHLSLYNLTFEPKTLYFRRQKQLRPLLPSPETSFEMLQAAVTHLEKIGLKRYEISAFAKPGFESHHNIGYWTARPFLGFGPSAFSYREGKRWRNIENLKKYHELLKTGLSPVDFEEKLSEKAHLHELLAVRLRLVEGVDMRDFPVDPSLYEKLQKEGWIKMDSFKAYLTEAGRNFYDTVATEIILID